MAAKPTMNSLKFDEENEDKIAAHGLRPRDLLEVIDHKFLISRNRKARRGAHLVIGRDLESRCITVQVEPTLDPTEWRPVTAWFGKAAEAALCLD